MTRIPTRFLVLGVAGLIALLTVGTSVALAHGGFGMGPGARGTADAKALFADAAKRLGVSTEKLSAAIVADATARIDRAVKAGKLDEDHAADLKDDLKTQPFRAVPLTTATGVARELGTTKAKLDEAFRAARKAQITARIDQAVKDGKLTKEQADDLKADLDDAVLPGYKAGPGFGGRGHHGPSMGMGMGPGMMGPGMGGQGSMAPQGYRVF